MTVEDPPACRCSVGRYYDPATGQFISIDPAVDQTEQPYAYADGDPVAFVDPLGLSGGLLKDFEATVNPWSPSNPIRRLAASGSPASNILYLNPAYWAETKYAAEAQAYEHGCSFGKTAALGAEATIALALSFADDDAGALEGVTARNVDEAAGGVYSLRNEAGEVVRTGRTNDLVRRAGEHGRDPKLDQYRFQIEYRTDDYAAQRGLEQLLHDEFLPPLNKINPIAARNSRRAEYMRAGRGFRNGP